MQTSSEITWVAIDPGDSRYSPQHIESLITTASIDQGLVIEWLATVPITLGESRYGFVVGAKGEVDSLTQTVLHSLGEQASLAEDHVINSVTQRMGGRFIIFPSEIDNFHSHPPAELIEKTAIEAVTAIGEDLPSDAIVQTHNYLRPTLINGAITLLVERLYTGEFAPIEKENPHQCCGGAHAPF